MASMVNQHTAVLCGLFLAYATAGAGQRLSINLTRGTEQTLWHEQEKQNNRPIIGILSQPGPPAPKNYSYIAASYIKFVEASGARVIPLQYDLPAEEFKRRFQIINGVLIPGGGQVLSPNHPFYDAVALLVDLGKAANDAGDYFPIHGTCLGFEALAVVAANNASVLTNFDALDNASPLYLTEHAEHSRLFGSMPDHIVHRLQQQPYAMENHQYGLSWRSYQENPGLREFYNILSLSADRQGNVYVSTLESPQYPITATQFHPEKNTFEWSAANHLHIPHSAAAVEVQRAFADFFISEARKNFHSPANEVEEDDLLIYNNQLIFTGRHEQPEEETSFDECYIFANAQPAVSRQSLRPTEAPSQ